MTVEEEILSPEEILTVRWRRTCFRSLGVDRDTADLLANGTTDWHELAALIAAGCPVDTAVRILL